MRHWLDEKDGQLFDGCARSFFAYQKLASQDYKKKKEQNVQKEDSDAFTGGCEKLVKMEYNKRVGTANH